MKIFKVNGDVLDAWVRNYNGEGTAHEFFCVYSTKMIDDDGIFDGNATIELPITPEQAKNLKNIKQNSKITITITIEE